MKQLIFLVLTGLIFTGCNNNNDKVKETDTDLPAIKSTPLISYVIKGVYPHNTDLFTEGFLVHDGKLFESTGSPADLPHVKSVVGISNLANGTFDQKIEIDRNKYFGEGIVFLKGKLYQLTYENKLGFIYDAATFKQIGKFEFKNAEGWGMTTDGKNLIMSDGTPNLTYLEPDRLSPVKTLQVTENGRPLPNVNELELIKGFIYANVWQTNYIVKIDTATGNVVGKLDLTDLTNQTRSKNANVDVLNGIAYDSVNNKIYVTGKLWPDIYQIEFPL